MIFGFAVRSAKPFFIYPFTKPQKDAIIEKNIKERQSMTCFLTSAPIMNDDHSWVDINNFVTELRAALKPDNRILFVCSDPNSHDETDLYAIGLMKSLISSGINVSETFVLDGRNKTCAKELVDQADLIFLAGGHVLTQNKFFEEIGLKDLLKGYEGVLMGLSAGSMNSAGTVYAQPELKGEAVDPNYKRFLNGLGLTDISIIPHYQAIKDDILDGLRIFEDIAYPDSMGRKFYAIPDGTYIYIKDGAEELLGEAYLIEDGKRRQISNIGDMIRFS